MNCEFLHPEFRAQTTASDVYNRRLLFPAEERSLLVDRILHKMTLHVHHNQTIFNLIPAEGHSQLQRTDYNLG